MGYKYKTINFIDNIYYIIVNLTYKNTKKNSFLYVQYYKIDIYLYFKTIYILKKWLYIVNFVFTLRPIFKKCYISL